MNIIQLLNFITSIILLYPSLKLTQIAIRGLFNKNTRWTSTGLVVLFVAFGVGSLINALLYAAIGLQSISANSIAQIAMSRVLVQNLLLLIACYILIQVSRGRV